MSLESRLRKLENTTAIQSREGPTIFAIYSDGESQAEAVAAAEAEYRAKNNLPETQELFCIAIHAVSPEWWRAANGLPPLIEGVLQ